MSFTLELATITEKLIPVYHDRSVAHHHAQLIMQALTHQTPTQLLLQKKISLTEQQNRHLQQWLDEIINRQKPIAYCIGQVPFLDLTLTIQPPILIPRQETETWCADLIQEKLSCPPKTILDLCTGSGCLGLAFAYAFPSSTVHACDINTQALALARHNAEKNNISNIHLFHGDLFEAIPATTYSLIITNPPYISESEYHDLEPSVQHWEDKHALVAGNDGYAIIKKIIEQAPCFLDSTTPNCPAELWIEIGHKQGALVAQMMLSSGFYNVRVVHDIAQRARIVRGSYKHGKYF